MAEEKEQISGRLREERLSNNNLDQSLMNRSALVNNDSEDDSGTGDNRNQNQSSLDNSVDLENEAEQEETEIEDEGNDLRAQQNQTRQQQDGTEDEDNSESSQPEPPSAMSKVTASWLKAAWINLIPTFGFSALYVAIHQMMSQIVGPKVFCKLGQEWVPKEISALDGGKTEEMGKKLGCVETAGCCVVNSCLGLLIMIALVQLALVAYVYLHPIDALVEWWSFMGDIIKAIGGMILP